jgi:hypothetical protein
MGYEFEALDLTQTEGDKVLTTDIFKKYFEGGKLCFSSEK